MIKNRKIKLSERFGSIDEAKRFIDQIQKDKTENFEIIVLWEQDVSDLLKNKLVK